MVVVGEGGARAAEVRGGARGSGPSTQEREEVAASESEETPLLFVEANGCCFGFHGAIWNSQHCPICKGKQPGGGGCVKEKGKTLLKKAIGCRKKGMT